MELDSGISDFTTHGSAERRLMSEVIKDCISHPFTPFKPLPRSIKALVLFCLSCVWFVELLGRRRFFTESSLGNFSNIDSRVRRVLGELVTQKVIKMWYVFATKLSGGSSVVQALIQIAPYQAPNGLIFPWPGGLASGVSMNLHDAMCIALAETVERHALYAWSSERKFEASYREVFKKALPLHEFKPYSETQLSTPDFWNWSLRNTDQKMLWMWSNEFVSGLPVLLPAQLVYCNYNQVRPDEQQLLEVTSNGVAASTNLKLARHKAILEAIERDAFLLHWLNETPPTCLDIGSIDDVEILGLLEIVKKHDYEITILDFPNDIQIPVMGALMFGPSGKRAVTIQLAAGFDVRETLRKVILDCTRSLRVANSEVSKSFSYQDIINNPQLITNINSRRELWQHPEMIPHVSFLKKGQVIGWQQYKHNYSLHCSMSLNGKEEWVRTRLRSLGYQCYVANITSITARRYGLHVTRAFLPQLIPMYFDEKRVPLGIIRLNKMRGGLNTVPHPFL